jgi:hypothetical protein
MRIRLIHTSDQYTKLQSGDMGTVLSKSQDPWGDTVVSVKWDSGSSLSLIEGIDQYEEVDA